MRALALIVVASCWRNAETIREVPVFRTKFIHDAPRGCRELPTFPNIRDYPRSRDFEFVHDLDRWIFFAAACLNADVYSVQSLIEMHTWGVP